MEYNPEFPIPAGGKLEAVNKYFQIEQDFMAVEKYFDSFRNGQIRKNAVRHINSWCSRVDYSDAFIPYLAMNYFDRYVSRHSLPNTESTPVMNVRLVAVSCFTIAAKIRTKPFSLTKFWYDQFLTTPYEKILQMELTVLNGLDWRIRPVTAFCFLDYYYPRFSSLGFTRRSISEIIIQFTSLNSSTRYSPSLIALSSLLAATQIAAPAKYEELRPKEEVTPYLDEECLAELIDMCKKKNISIETAGTNFAASTSTSTITPLAGGVASEEATPTNTEPISRRPGKEALIPDESDSSEEIVSATEDKPNVSAAEDKPKELLNFKLLWEPEDWDFFIPPIVSLVSLMNQDTAAAISEDGDEDRSADGSVKKCPCHWNCDSFTEYCNPDSCCECECCKIM